MTETHKLPLSSINCFHDVHVSLFIVIFLCVPTFVISSMKDLCHGFVLLLLVLLYVHNSQGKSILMLELFISFLFLIPSPSPIPLDTNTHIASHFRFGTISWQLVDGKATTVQFTINLAFRRAYFSSRPVVGTVIPANQIGTYPGIQYSSILLEGRERK